jgi:heme/copper-type cytochrome/quinol oxidase subunit 1
MGLLPDGGWFMYPPLSSAAFSPGIGADVWHQRTSIGFPLNGRRVIIVTDHHFTRREMKPVAHAIICVVHSDRVGDPDVSADDHGHCWRWNELDGRSFRVETAATRCYQRQHLFWLFSHPGSHHFLPTPQA